MAEAKKTPDTLDCYTCGRPLPPPTPGDPIDLQPTCEICQKHEDAYDWDLPNDEEDSE